MKIVKSDALTCQHLIESTSKLRLQIPWLTDVILKKLISEKQMAENVSTESDNAF